MKAIKYIAFLAVGASLVSCEDLDTEPQGATLTQAQREKVISLEPSRGEAAVNSLFAAMKAYEPNSGAIGSMHCDFGYGSIMLITDSNGDDMPAGVTGYNWFSGEIEYTDRTVSSTRNQIIWNDLYSYIYTANSILADLGTESDDAKTQFFIANAKAMRAFSYFTLAQLYQYNYKGNEQKPCVPLITEANSEAALKDGQPRATVAEVYTQILSDLNSAIDLLSASAASYERDDKRYVSLGVAYGLRARVNLTMQDYEAAIADATLAIEDAAKEGIEPASISEVSVPAFSNIKETSWMWGIKVDETDESAQSEIVNWISHIGSFNYGYAEVAGGKQISTKLYNTISETDVRKGWWLNDTCYSANLNRQQLYFVSGEYAGYAPYTSVKFASYKDVLETSTNANDIPLMRVEEMYLIKAEAEARAGKGGLETLNYFVKNFRDPEYNYTGANVAGEVLRQKRIELWGEGLIWYDIMRLGLGIDRRGAGYDPAYVFVIADDDPILLWPIPQAEIEANKKLSTSDQNPLGTTPQPETDLDIPYVVD